MSKFALVHLSSFQFGLPKPFASISYQESFLTYEIDAYVRKHSTMQKCELRH